MRARTVSSTGVEPELKASSFGCCPRKGLVPPSDFLHFQGSLPVNSTSGALESAKPSIACCVRTTSGAVLESSSDSISCGRRSSRISCAVACGATETDLEKSPAAVSLVNERPSWASGMKGVIASESPDSTRSNQAKGPANPSLRLERASAARRGCTTRSASQANRMTTTEMRAPVLNSQMGGSATRKRLANSGIMEIVGLGDMDKKWKETVNARPAWYAAGGAVGRSVDLYLVVSVWRSIVTRRAIPEKPQRDRALPARWNPSRAAASSRAPCGYPPYLDFPRSAGLRPPSGRCRPGPIPGPR